jgi:hypothetical protein
LRAYNIVECRASLRDIQRRQLPDGLPDMKAELVKREAASNKSKAEAQQIEA